MSWLEGELTTLGRHDDAGIRVDGDEGISRIHAEFRRAGNVWLLYDDGLSRNGSYVNGERTVGRRRLEDGDVLTFGSTLVLFRSPEAVADRTKAIDPAPAELAVTAADRCLLEALCRPLLDGTHAAPATNREIGAELYISLPAVKRRLGVLFERFGLERLPQNEKRARLAEEAMRQGLISSR